MVAVIERCSVVVIGEEEVGGEVDEGDGVMNKGDNPPPPMSLGRSLRTAV